MIRMEIVNPATVDASSPKRWDALLALACAAFVVLCLILLGVLYQAHTIGKNIDNQTAEICNQLKYTFPEDPDSDFGGLDYDADQIEQSFSDLSKTERAQADRLDCDIEGR